MSAQNSGRSGSGNPTRQRTDGAAESSFQLTHSGFDAALGNKVS